MAAFFYRRCGVPSPPGASLQPTSRRRSRPVGDGVPDVPFLRPPTASPRSSNPRRGRRPRRPLPTSIADLTAFRQPPRRGGVPPPARRAFTTRATALQRLRAAGAARKGGTPGEGSPFDPLLRFISKGAFRALRRASMGSAPGPRPLFCKKAGQKTFTGLDFCQPEPLALGASDEISPRSGHLSGRVAPPTRVGEAGGSRNLTGAPPPKSVFLWGSTPFLWARPKKWGGTAAQAKVKQNKTASS